MEATRQRFSSLLEWAAASLCILGLLALAAVVIRDFRTVTAMTPVIAHEEALPNPPAAIPPRSVSVPLLLLPDGGELHVGDTADELAGLLGPNDEIAPAAVDRTEAGERVTRFYAHDGQRFAVVLQPQAADGAARIAAIYVPSSR